ncbi:MULTISPECIES: 50S ribosomal protein L1 [Borrelia]|uniref:Large ribosomal subunit protein uL1 n=4 Tax=Borrelia TaxID=138 RepID=RL1_BORHD|nr:MULTISPECIES: 50S ribosomal protein L1 [Borrelia]B2S095.1 RecName: Full=Large ribosomal subunit protein uL1; AltName: Full=50S ribosomal protein L1 [Borrelia hermsii DAH]AAX16901.1 LSU ribosomal protein L1P [Borrelia hermsii DAH]AHH03374.1 LSU ribosomal protein L1P [Borrelia nietonii YOR]AHH13889.1 LSU ribosomal protein L1P [Borrelia hermsii MTW]AJW73199.1 50S ribosomal protein L1 [Borrelia hermsii CC1]AMR75448.1 50S ribosomal protein L1 [Borrelia hermsii]
MAKSGKKYMQAISKIDKLKSYSIDDAISLLKEIKFVKFDETIDVSINLNLKKNHTVRDTVVLPNQFMKEKRILVFAKGDRAQEAKEAGAAYVGDDDLINKVKGGFSDFDIVVATPDMMKDVGKLGPILGKRGLMPNPKTQTITNDLKGTIAGLKKGRTEFRANKNGVLNFSVGKSSMDNKKIKENYDEFIKELLKRRPSDLKGTFVDSVYISSTMGPSVKIDFV